MLSLRESARHSLVAGAAIIGIVIADPAPATAQFSTVYEQTYLPASHNWAFRNNYPGADRLFNAFDYGHAILYEDLWTHPDAPETILEERRYDFITKKLLVSPPRLPLEEAAIEVAYARLAPEAKMMFDWAHILHRQIYDVWADESIDAGQKDHRIEELLRYYKSRPDLAFSSQPKDMNLMEGRYYSKEFRTRYPKFNGLIWAYHWLQVGLYEPLVTASGQAERQTGVTNSVARFRKMLENPPVAMPTVMPMTAAIAPEFARRYPEAAIIFDNLHGMHDVISDILSSPKVARRDKRREILEAARLYRDDTSFVTTRTEWLEMSVGMGVENMGGGAGWRGPDSRSISEGDPELLTAVAEPGMSRSPSEAVQKLLIVMFADSIIRSRSAQDTTLARLVREAELDMHLPAVLPRTDTVPAAPATHEHTTPNPPPAKPPVKKKSAAAERPVVKRPVPARKPEAKPVEPTPTHSGHH